MVSHEKITSQTEGGQTDGLDILINDYGLLAISKIDNTNPPPTPPHVSSVGTQLPMCMEIALTKKKRKRND